MKVEIGTDELSRPDAPGFVPCNGCTLCCRFDAVRLLPADDAATYETEAHPYRPGERMLAHKPDGACIYLGPQGCTIHERKPTMCKQMDCRAIARRISLKHADKLGMKAVWLKGKNMIYRAAHPGE